MTRTLVRLAAVAAGAAALAGPAAAQPPAPGGPGAYNRPVVSPYINIVGGFGNAAANYFGIVRPQMQARQAILGLENSVIANRQAIANVEQGIAGGEFNLPGTGHPTQFLNTGGYFLNSGGTAGGTFGGGGAAGPRQSPAGFGQAPPSRGRGMGGRGATGMQSVGGPRR